MSEENREKLELVDDPKDILEGLSDEEQIRLWETHDPTEEFLNKVKEVPADERPRPRERTRPINVRFDDFTLVRLKALAERRNTGYQTLLKEFVAERLYEEEKRKGILPAGREDQAQAATDLAPAEKGN